MALNLRLPNDSLVLKAYASLIGAAPGSTAFNEHKAFIAANGQNAYVSALNSLFASVSNTDLATAIRANLGLTAVVTQATTEAFLAANASNRVGAIFAIADVLASTTDASLATAKAAYNAGIDASYNYSVVATNYVGTTIAALTAVATSVELTTGVDKLTGTSGKDLFNAYILDNGNTLQSGDVINGGAGDDTLFAEIGNSAKFAISATTTGVETIKLQVQAKPNDITNGNNTSGETEVQGTVQIDAQKMAAVSTWHNFNSRSDLIIEDVRIADGAKTKEVSIVMESTDPGNVDFGVYFDQHSLRNSSTGNTTLNIRLMDTGAAGAAATAATPLLNNPYDQFKLGVNGVLTTIQLDKAAVAAAETYEALLTVFQTALSGTGITATLSGTFTITDPLSNTQVTGKQIVLTGGQGVVITAPAQSGWYNTTGASVPPNSNIYTTFDTTALTQTELVTSTIVLDDVGRGSTGGDLVVGGQSVGATSGSRGVERFEIEVRDNSKLQTINSTNDALREVTIKNGVTTNTSSNQGVYDQTVANAGNLTVNGNANPTNAVQGQSAKGAGSDLPLAGLDELHHNNTGFTDVRLIDGSAMTGKLAFTAAITENSIKKYIEQVDTQANPTADVAGSGNVNYKVKGANFDYKGGANADTISVTIDGGVAGSRSKIVSGQSDFTFLIDGGAGDDTITLAVRDSSVVGNQQNWYANQDLNNNITITAGAGDDVVKTPGAGDLTIDLGAGDDVAYTDNTGSVNYGLTTAVTNNSQNKAAWVFNTFDQTALLSNTAVAVRNLNDLRSDANDSYNFFKATLVVTFKNLPSKSITIDNTNYKTSDLQINQAIKNAINNDATLKNLLVAKDGPSNTLVVESLIDGALAAGDLSVAVSLPTTLSAAEIEAASLVYGDTAAVAAANAAAGISSLVGAGKYLTVGLAAYTTADDYAARLATNGTSELTGAASTTTSDNFITPGAGNDLVVLGTTVGTDVASSSNEVVSYGGEAFGNDVIVNFAATGNGKDYLDFNGALGNTFQLVNFHSSANPADIGVFNAANTDVIGGKTVAKNTINIKPIDTSATGNDTAAKVKVLFDAGAGDAVVAANAGKHIYIAQSTHNVGKVFLIVDGAADNDSVVTELGSIDLADVAWTGLDGSNFVKPGVYDLGGSSITSLPITGTTGADTLIGTGSADTINALGGTDTVTGGAGVDTIDLGADAVADTIVLTAVTTAADRDVVTNFVSATDKVTLGLANTTLGTAAGAAVVTADTTVAGVGGGAYTMTGASTANADVILLNTTGAVTAVGVNSGNLSLATDGTELLKALTTAAAADTYTGITAAAAGQKAYLVASQGGSTYVYLASDADSNSLIVASEITLVGTFSGTAAMVAADFQLA